jgi:hypothetical protein
MLMEQLEYNLLFRWFVGLGMDDAVWAPTTFTKNRDRLLDGDIAAAFFDAVLLHADTERLLSDEHFTVDGTLLEAWASQKSFRPRDQDPPTDGGGNPTVNFHGQRRTNATHQSTTDPDARLYKKARGREARLGYLGHVLMEHRSGLIVVMVTPADGWRTRCAVVWSRCSGRHRMRLPATGLRHARPGRRPARDARHTARRATRRADAARSTRATRHRGCAISQQTEARPARLRLDENDRRLAQAAPPWRTARGLGLHLYRRGATSSNPPIAGSDRMSMATTVHGSAPTAIRPPRRSLPRDRNDASHWLAAC